MYLVKGERRHEQMGMGGTDGTKMSILDNKNVSSSIFFDTNEGSLGNAKRNYKGIWFFDKGGMGGLGATWNKQVVFAYHI
jgi:hypothetical protein